MSAAPTTGFGRAAFLALASGLCLPLALAPVDLAPLAVLSFAFACAALHGRSVREAAVLAWIMGLGRYGLGVSWVFVSIHEHGGAPVPLALAMVVLFVVFMALFPALMGAGFAALRPRTPLQTIAALAACEVLLEWTLTWFLTGFPWLFAGYSQLATPLAGWAPVTGVLGVSLLVALTGGLLWGLWRARGQGRALRAAASLVLGSWIVGAILGTVDWTRVDGRALDVALVQGAVPQALKWRPEMREPITDRYLELSAPHWSADLVLWPEAALTVFARDASTLLGRIARRAEAQGATLVLGLPDYDRDPADPRRAVFRNTAVALGAGEGRYVKQRLVPFGEYVPLEDLLRGVIEFFDLPMSHAGAGPADQALLQAGDVRLSMAICYEIAYGALVRRQSAGAGVLLTISNDTWFGGSFGPSQHLQIARYRALELQRPLLRATNDGITAIVGADGDLVARLPRFEAGVLAGRVEPRTGLTPYGRIGDALALLLALGCLVPTLWTRVRGHRKGTSPDGAG